MLITSPNFDLLNAGTGVVVINSLDCPVAVGMLPISFGLVDETGMFSTLDLEGNENFVYTSFSFGLFKNCLTPGIRLARMPVPIAVAPSAANPPIDDGSVSSTMIDESCLTR